MFYKLYNFDFCDVHHAFKRGLLFQLPSKSTCSELIAMKRGYALVAV